MSATDARTWRVPADAHTVQAGIDSAQAGDDVLLAPGTYTWTSQGASGDFMVSLKAGVTLHSEAGAEATVLDAEKRARVILCVDVGDQTRIEDLTIQNGRSRPPSPEPARGGGIYVTGNSAPTIARCIIKDNEAVGQDAAGGLGGGVYCDVATLSNCDFVGNFAGDFAGSNGFGGAVFCGAARLDGCVFKDNRTVGDAFSRGGAVLAVSAVISNCVFENNVTSAFRTACGGAIEEFGLAAITGCMFVGNLAQTMDVCALGGAIRLGASGGTVSECIFVENVARGLFSGFAEGGAILAISGASTISNCLFIHNAALREQLPGIGGAIHANQGAVVENCTLIGNSGGLPTGVGGIWMNSGGTVRATIITDTTGQVCGGAPGPTWTCCDLFGNTEGNQICGTDGGGNFSADPEFCAVDPATSLNVLLQKDSPCAPGNHPSGTACGLIGASPVGCGSVSIEQTTWSGLKSLYRR